MANLTLYQYPRCSTCRKAVKWLEAADRDFDAVHLVETTPDVSTLRDLWQRSGLPLRRFFNTSGNAYREGNFTHRLVEMSDTEKLESLAADGMLIKRPILDTGASVVVGFREDAYAAAFNPTE
jgi:arsenate reductase